MFNRYFSDDNYGRTNDTTNHSKMRKFRLQKGSFTFLTCSSFLSYKQHGFLFRNSPTYCDCNVNEFVRHYLLFHAGGAFLTPCKNEWSDTEECLKAKFTAFD